MKYFCLPFNGDTKFILDYCKNHGDLIHEVYGAEGIFATGRFTHHVDERIICELIPKLKDLGIGFNYLLNSISIKSYISQQDQLQRHLENLKAAGLTTVTASHPHMVGLLRGMGFVVSTSLIQNIKTIEDKEWAERFGYSRIICSDDLNRRIVRLKGFVSSANVPVEIVANNMCLPSCPLRHSHYGLEAYGDEYGWDEQLKRTKKQVVLCRKLWGENPVFFLKSSWIRPEDIKRFLKIGVRFIKIAGRDRNSESLKQTFDSYLLGECKGKVFDYLLPGSNPVTKYNLYNFDNKQLEEYFAHIFSLHNGCLGNCNTCNYCETYIKSIL